MEVALEPPSGEEKKIDLNNAFNRVRYFKLKNKWTKNLVEKSMQYALYRTESTTVYTKISSKNTYKSGKILK